VGYAVEAVEGTSHAGCSPSTIVRQTICTERRNPH